MSALDYLRFFIFCYFFQVALIVFFIIGALGSGSSYTDIISAIYIFVAIYYLIESRQLVKHKNRVWNKLLYYNLVIMVFVTLY
jgi:hypothetical protein